MELERIKFKIILLKIHYSYDTDSVRITFFFLFIKLAASLRFQVSFFVLKVYKF
jgi:hypothetical protein